MLKIVKSNYNSDYIRKYAVNNFSEISFSQSLSKIYDSCVNKQKNIQMLNNIKSFVIFVFVLSVFIGSSISYGIIYPLRLISPLLMIGIILFYYDKKPILTF